MLAALWGSGLGLLPLLFTTNPYFIAGILPVASAAVVLNVLPYSVLMGLLPEEYHGAGASLFGFSRGVGVLLGPLLAGLAILLLGQANFLVFAKTQGFAAMFVVASAFLLSIPVLRRMNVEGKASDEMRVVVADPRMMKIGAPNRAGCRRNAGRVARGPGR